MPSVFVSYRRKPSAILAQLIVKDLKEQEIEVYLDIERMEGAGNFPTRLFQAIEVSDVFVCLLGEGTLDSEWVQYEIKHAAELGKPMIPVFQESFEPMALDQVPNQHTKALLEHDGVYIFDLKNVYVPQAVEALARMIENTANWLKQTPAPADGVNNIPIISVNIEALAGQKFGQYEIRDMLGMGGMSAVYRAHQESLLRDVAIKILPPSIASQQSTMDRFLREARTAAALEHAHIVPVYDYGNYGGLSFVVMRLLSGGSLAERLAFTEKEGRSLPSLAESAAVLKDLAGALDYAHSRGVIHRDIKANNIMFDDQGNPFIVDFGIAKLTNAQNALTGTGVAMGTPLYMSPEQWRGESVTPAADQYALGVTAYAMLTGHLPFEAPTPYALMHKHLNEHPVPPQTWRADMPDAVRDVLNQAMAKNPRYRFPSAKDFAEAFENAVRESGIEEEPTSFFTEALPDKPQTPISPLLGGTPLPDTSSSKPGFTPPPAPLPTGTPSGMLVSPTPLPTTPPTLYSTPPELRPPTPLMPMPSASGAPTPLEEPLLRTDPTATMMSASHTPAPPPPAAPVPDQPTPLLTRIPAPENVVAPPPGYVQQITPSGVPIFVPQQLTEEPTASFPSTALMPAVRPQRSNTPVWALAAIVVIVLGLLGVVALILNSQNQQTIFQSTQAAILAAIIQSSATATETATFTNTPTPTLTATATASPTPATPVVQAISDVIARVGPGPNYPEVATLAADGKLDLVGLSEDGAWYQVVLPDGSRGWIVSSQSLVNIFGDADLLEIVPAPTDTPSPTSSPTRTPTPTATRTPSPTATDTETPTSTPTLTATRTPRPTSTITPSQTQPPPTLTRTPRVTATPSPRPTRPSVAQSTPRPTATPTT